MTSQPANHVAVVTTLFLRPSFQIATQSGALVVQVTAAPVAGSLPVHLS